MDNLGELEVALQSFDQLTAVECHVQSSRNFQANTIAIFSNLNRHAKTLKSECSKTYYKQHPD